MRTRNMKHMKTQNLEVFGGPYSFCTQFYTIESTFYNQNHMGTLICETLYIIQKVRTRNMEQMKTNNLKLYGTNENKEPRSVRRSLILVCPILYHRVYFFIINITWSHESVRLCISTRK